MSATIQFHVTHLDTIFHIIGSADRDLLLDIGVTLGSEFRPPLDDEDDEFFGDEETNEPPEWNSDEEEADAAQEIIIKMIMTELPHDLAEDEAYAVQDYFASYAHRDEHVHQMEYEDLARQVTEDYGAETADAIQKLLLQNVDEPSIATLQERLEEADASHELISRIRMLTLGRLPESDEPTFTDLEDEVYSARFGYIYAKEATHVADEMDALAKRIGEETGPVAYLVAALFNYCSSHDRDLLVTIDE